MAARTSLTTTRHVPTNADKSPWTALEYCNDVQDLTNTWICHGPESCGCDWTPSKNMLLLQPRGCRDMGRLALVALYAPSKLAPYISLPETRGGSTGYYSPTISAGTSTWVETAVPGYTPEVFTQLTRYREAPRTNVWVDAEATPGTGTYAAAKSWTGSAPTIGTTASAGATGTSTEAPSLQSEDSSSAAGLSTGAKVGIGVGVAGGVLILAGLGVCICLFLRRKQKARASAQENQHQQQYPPSPPQMQMPPYPSPPQQQHMTWAPIQSGPPLMDPAYGYGAPSPQHSEMSRSVSQGKTSYSQMSSPPPPMPVMELAGEELRRSVHEMESESRDEARKRQGTGMDGAF
ncbi:hypothetical protein PRZ48_010287 [Zasmidium cellare]|uniref:Uncharacterized protein n=1 Tax=Zasmidium cellare TaxID=395010 RepID=A0ABR0E888_ZASCE|nr:hypothetical protein PRZ48_010287 [Zasmidium cellare]